MLIEDDLEISDMLKKYLEAENFQIVIAQDGEEACHIFEGQTFDLVLLDLMIPKISGMDVLQQIRKTSVVPVLILSAKDADADKMLGLGLGADDYITIQKKFILKNKSIILYGRTPIAGMKMR